MIRRGRLTREERERGFALNSGPAPLPSYDALRDGNLRQYFESKTVQTFLQSSGWIDKEGRIVDLDKFRHVLHALHCLLAWSLEVPIAVVRTKNQACFTLMPSAFIQMCIDLSATCMFLQLHVDVFIFIFADISTSTLACICNLCIPCEHVMQARDALQACFACAALCSQQHVKANPKTSMRE